MIIILSSLLVYSWCPEGLLMVDSVITPGRPVQHVEEVIHDPSWPAVVYYEDEPLGVKSHGPMICVLNITTYMNLVGTLEGEPIPADHNRLIISGSLFKSGFE